MRDEKLLEEGEKDNRLSTRMFRMKAAFINIAFDHSHVYDRWTNITSYFGMGNKDKQQTPTANDKEIETTRQNHQQWSSPQPARHRRREVSTGSRVWDAERTAREGGGGPARVAKFRDRSTQQLGSAADSTPVVL
jgi:hypothetical protein